MLTFSCIEKNIKSFTPQLKIKNPQSFSKMSKLLQYAAPEILLFVFLGGSALATYKIKRLELELKHAELVANLKYKQYPLA
jgi:hypothetical protein